MGKKGEWATIGITILAIVILFSLIITSRNESKIDQLVINCMNVGGEPVTERKGFSVFLTSYKVECKK